MLENNCPLEDPHNYFHNRRPDFLVISPPKTGSTWLAENLRHHPQLFIHPIKEVKYFNSFFKWLDHGWYCTHFNDAGSQKAGEASPSYASLPVGSIRVLHKLLPDVKIVFLMRDPISRAWSHAKHNQAYREANFTTAEVESDPTALTDAQWSENFYHDWPLTSGDYLGQLRRWTSVFPKKQLYVGFYESIVTRPETLLREVFHFLGVDPELDLSGFPVQKHFLSGSTISLTPTLHARLHTLLHDRSMELARFLKNYFELEPPTEWNKTLLGSPEVDLRPAQAFLRENDDEYLTKVMAMGRDISFRLSIHRGVSRVPHLVLSRPVVLFCPLAGPHSEHDPGERGASTAAK